MSNLSIPQATAYACLRIALRADAAGVRLRAGMEALILVLLAHLFGRTGANWHDLPEDDDYEYEYEARWYTMVRPTMGSAPHAAVVEAGLVPDWVLSGYRNRGMRRRPVTLRHHRRPDSARAPPPAIPIPR